jgi:hypothetical protein
MKIVFFILFFSFCYSQTPIVCYGTTKNYSVDTFEGGFATPNGTVGSTYTWKILEANQAVITGNGSNVISINWGATPVNTYTIQVDETNSSCLGQSVVLTVKIKKNPTISVAPILNVCSGLNTFITATANPSNPDNSFTWSSPVYTGSTNSDTIDIFNANYALSGDYIVKVVDSDGCESNSATAKLTVQTNPDASIKYLSPLTFCAGESVILEMVEGLVSGFTYQWMKDAVDVSTASTSFNYTAKESGNYTVRVSDTNFPTNCTTTTSSPIIVVKKSLPETSVITAY